MLESVYQGKLIKKIETRFPGSVALKNDTGYRQGIPDLTILFRHGFWAELEVKPQANSPRRPNQEHYIELFDEMSYAAFIDPENEEEILRDLQHLYESRRNARVS